MATQNDNPAAVGILPSLRSSAAAILAGAAALATLLLLLRAAGFLLRALVNVLSSRADRAHLIRQAIASHHIRSASDLVSTTGLLALTALVLAAVPLTILAFRYYGKIRLPGPRATPADAVPAGQRTYLHPSHILPRLKRTAVAAALGFLFAAIFRFQFGLTGILHGLPKFTADWGAVAVWGFWGGLISAILIWLSTEYAYAATFPFALGESYADRLRFLTRNPFTLSEYLDTLDPVSLQLRPGPRAHWFAQMQALQLPGVPQDFLNAAARCSDPDSTQWLSTEAAPIPGIANALSASLMEQHRLACAQYAKERKAEKRRFDAEARIYATERAKLLGGKQSDLYEMHLCPQCEAYDQAHANDPPPKEETFYPETCPKCKGSRVSGYRPITKQTGGWGQSHDANGNFSPKRGGLYQTVMVDIPCPACHGSGHTDRAVTRHIGPSRHCWTCDGSGFIITHRGTNTPYTGPKPIASVTAPRKPPSEKELCAHLFSEVRKQALLRLQT